MVTACSGDPVRLLEGFISEQIGPAQYKVWFRNATRFMFDEDFVKVEVPNQFIGSWIENHFSEVINNAVEKVAGRKMDVTFGIDADLARNLRKKQPDSQVRDVAAAPERSARRQKKHGSLPAPSLRGRFEDFVVSGSNELAYSTAMGVAKHPASQFNPLFIHGGCGLGKTHLLHAICNYVQRNGSDMKCLFVTGEDFTNQFVYAVKCGQRDSFRHRYRGVDVLVIDDIHFLANKRATQEEFLHTFNAIADLGKQIVMASDAHPKLIGHLSESLVTRFVAGMVVKIDPPDLRLRTEVLKRRAAKMDVVIPDDVVECIANSYTSNVRELEGALLKLVALTRFTGQPLTVATAEKAVRDMVQTNLPVVELSNVESQVAIFFGLSPADLHSSRKTRTIALARGIVTYLTRKHTRLSYPDIARHMGKKNHSTFIQANKRVNKLIKDDEQVTWSTPAGEKQASIRELLDQISQQLQSPEGKR